jgi:cell division protein FtsQ
MRRGPELIFGSATRLAAKWAAASAVLADRKARGATYVDLRLPERPAAGGVAEEEIAVPAQAVPQAATTQPPSPPGGPTAPAAPQAAPQGAPQTAAPAGATAPAPSPARRP